MRSLSLPTFVLVASVAPFGCGVDREDVSENGDVGDQAEAGVPIKEPCWKYVVSEATFYTWRKKYGGLAPSEAEKRPTAVPAPQAPLEGEHR